MGIGEIAALSAALMWTCSSMLWGKIHLSALGLNFCKNIIGTILVAVQIFLLCLFMGRAGLVAPLESWLWLSLSGLIGIVIGDTVYFRSLQILGARRALMIATVSPIFAALFGWLILGESLIFVALLGIVLTVAGVVFVVADRKARSEEPGLMPGSARSGVLMGLGGAVCQSIGGVCSKKGMLNSGGEEICDAVEATFIRLLVAAFVTTLFVYGKKELPAMVSKAMQWKQLRLLIPATALGTWLGIWFSQLAYQYSNIAVAQTLLSTCPLFAIPIVWLVDGHKITLVSIFGTLAALIGIYLTVSS